MSLIFIFQNMIEQGMLGINENKMLLIDEPEAFLHPEAVRVFQSSNSVFDENDIANMKILNYVDSYINEYFFANNIIIVEGDTELSGDKKIVG